MANESQQRHGGRSGEPPGRRAEELDREPGSNRGTKGQMRESRNVARSAEDDIQTLAGHDDSGKGDRTEK
jgi:hypothetical protein